MSYLKWNIKVLIKKIKKNIINILNIFFKNKLNNSKNF